MNSFDFEAPLKDNELENDQEVEPRSISNHAPTHQVLDLGLNETLPGFHEPRSFEKKYQAPDPQFSKFWLVVPYFAAVFAGIALGLLAFLIFWLTSR
ncbi:MAG: hypothetical protein LBC43_02505 [Bifidobacteriaceae bacterium]|jgi:hypothetical protein|nr:hypothetical protein [Bifidobacteriaceae bacterium]